MIRGNLVRPLRQTAERHPDNARVVLDVVFTQRDKRIIRAVTAIAPIEAADRVAVRVAVIDGDRKAVAGSRQQLCGREVDAVASTTHSDRPRFDPLARLSQIDQRVKTRGALARVVADTDRTGLPEAVVKWLDAAGPLRTQRTVRGQQNPRPRPRSKQRVWDRHRSSGTVGDVAKLPRVLRCELLDKRRPVGHHQAQILTVGTQLEVRVELRRGNLRAARLGRSKHDQILTRIQDRHRCGGKLPSVQVGRVVRQKKPGQIDRLGRRVVELDPIGMVPGEILQRRIIRRHKFRDQDRTAVEHLTGLEGFKPQCAAA